MINKLLQAINERLIYKDRFSVSRKVNMLQDNKSLRQVLQPVPQLQNIACAFSSNSHASSFPNKLMEDSYHSNKIRLEKRIFCSSEHEILAGDTVFVTTRGGYERRFLAGEPMRYNDHQEVLLQTSDEA
jgi:hypothetical protein